MTEYDFRSMWYRAPMSGGNTMKIALTVSVSAIALGATGSACAAQTFVTFPPEIVELYSQKGKDTGVAAVSSNFTDGSFDTYSSAGADDFMVPSGHKWRIKEVDVTGAYFSGSGPVPDESVFLYENRTGKKALPGHLLAACHNIQGSDDNGSFVILLPKACQTSLRGGYTYWVSVVATSSYPYGAIWGWETSHHSYGNPAAWENPRDGLGTGCITWRVMQDCLGSGGEGPDFMFVLKGLDHLTGDTTPLVGTLESLGP
jgi:hypothetical protein